MAGATKKGSGRLLDVRWLEEKGGGGARSTQEGPFIEEIS